MPPTQADLRLPDISGHADFHAFIDMHQDWVYVICLFDTRSLCGECFLSFSDIVVHSRRYDTGKPGLSCSAITLYSSRCFEFVRSARICNLRFPECYIMAYMLRQVALQLSSHATAFRSFYTLAKYLIPSGTSFGEKTSASSPYSSRRLRADRSCRSSRRQNILPICIHAECVCADVMRMLLAPPSRPLQLASSHFKFSFE